ncbi:hypothetical protein PG984_002837 [Apiospora sp. TS-2023a]
MWIPRSPPPPPLKTVVTAHGMEIEVPRTYHSLVVHVKYSCGHKPQDKRPDGSKVKGASTIPAIIKLRGDDGAHAGPCLPFVKCLRGCYVTEMDHQLSQQCPVCEMADLMAEGVDMRF